VKRYVHSHHQGVFLPFTWKVVNIITNN